MWLLSLLAAFSLPSPPAASRRQLLSRAAASLPAPAALAFAAEAPSSVRVKGAAEMDLEFYARGLLGSGGAPRSAPPPPPLAARQLDAALAKRLLDAAAAGIAPSVSAPSAAKLRQAAGARRQALAIEYDRALFAGAFSAAGGYDTSLGGASALSQPEALQYGFDLSALALFTLLSEARLPRKELAACYARVGEELLVAVAAATPAPPQQAAGSASSLSDILRGVRALLDALQRGGYLAAYAIDDGDADEGLWQQRSSLSSTRLTVTLTDSAALRAALLLNGRGVSPELARPLLSAFFASRGAEVTEQSDFFLDGEYRENPKEYRPTQQLLSFTIAPSGAPR